MTAEKKIITITGATGNIGFRVATALLNQGIHEVRAVSRSKDSKKIKELERNGAKIFVSTLDNKETLAKAFVKTDIALVMTPAEYKAENFREVQIQSGKAIAEALAETRVRKVVSISGIGADVNGDTGVVMGLYHFERALNKLDSDILHLRATYFMENFFHMIHPIVTLGIAASPMKNNTPVAMVATKDVADAAIAAIQNPVFSGKSHRELLGPADLTMGQVIEVLGRAINRPYLRHFRLPDAVLLKGIQDAGNSADLARLSIGMHNAFANRTIKGTRSPETTTPTSIEDFAVDFASRFRSSELKPTLIGRIVNTFFKVMGPTPL